VIGDCLTEINVTSPTCFQEITQQTGFDVPAMFVDALEEQVDRDRTVI
jgi:glutathione synthase